MNLLAFCLVVIGHSSTDLQQLESELRKGLGERIVISPTWELGRTGNILTRMRSSTSVRQVILDQRLTLTGEAPFALRSQAFPLRFFPHFEYVGEFRKDRDDASAVRQQALESKSVNAIKVEKGSVLIEGETGITLAVSELERIPLTHQIRAPKIYENEVVVVSHGNYTEKEFVAAIANALGTIPSKDNNVLRLDPTLAKERWLANLESMRRFADDEFLTNRHEALIVAAKYAAPESVATILEDQTKYIDIHVSADPLLPDLAKRCYDTFVTFGKPAANQAEVLEYRERFRSRIDLNDPRPILFRFYGSGNTALMFPANDGKAYVGL